MRNWILTSALGTSLLIGGAMALPVVGLRAEDAPVSAAQKAKDARIVKALLSLSDVDLSSKPEAKASLLRYLTAHHGTEKYVEIVTRFKLVEGTDELLRMAIEDSEGSLGAQAAGALVKLDQGERINQELRKPETAAGVKLLNAIKLSGDAKANAVVLPLVTDAEVPSAIRTGAVSLLGANLPGQKALLGLVTEGKLLPEQKFAAASSLLSSMDEAIKTEAGKHLQLPATADSKPLPPVAELVKQSGDVEKGKVVFQTIGTCVKCHKVKGEGKEVGPDLTEIGSKLSKDAMYVSILDPSAGISHNYETHVLLLEDGTSVSGIIVSETEAEVAIKTIEAIVRKIPHDEITLKKKQNISLMPADLQRSLTAQNLVDLVEFLTTLKKS